MGFQRNVRRELRSPEEVLADPGVITADDLSGNRLVVGSTARGKSAMPDHNELTANLAAKAFEVIGSSSFQVTASLDVERPETLRDFGLLESILLMAYNEGKAAAERG